VALLNGSTNMLGTPLPFTTADIGGAGMHLNNVTSRRDAESNPQLNTRTIGLWSQEEERHRWRSRAFVDILC